MGSADHRDSYVMETMIAVIWVMKETVSVCNTLYSSGLPTDWRPCQSQYQFKTLIVVLSLISMPDEQMKLGSTLLYKYLVSLHLC